MTIIIPASGSAREPMLQERTEQLVDEARVRVAAHSADAGEFREIALMLGLIEVSPAGTLVKANPWDADAGEALPRSPKG